MTYSNVKVPTYEVHRVAFTPDDISRIWHKDLNGLGLRKDLIESLDRVRDMICLMANTGLRYSDARRLTKEHFKNGVIEILQQKTKMFAHIDIARMAIHKEMTIAILEKYDYQAPVTTDLSNFDKKLHMLMKLCGFDDIFQQEVIQNGKVTIKREIKYNLITSHTGRRTFVVNAALRGVPIAEIMRATGHKTYGAFRRYLQYY